MGLIALDVGDETHAAVIMLILRVIEALCGRQAPKGIARFFFPVLHPQLWPAASYTFAAARPASDIVIVTLPAPKMESIEESPAVLSRTLNIQRMSRNGYWRRPNLRIRFLDARYLNGKCALGRRILPQRAKKGSRQAITPGSHEKARKTNRTQILNGERAAAAAGALHVRVVELEARTFQSLDIIDLHPFQVHFAHLVDENL